MSSQPADLEPQVTISIPVGYEAVAIGVPARDAALWARWLVMDLAAQRAGRRGTSHIQHPRQYLESIVRARAPRLAADGPAREECLAEMSAKMESWASRQSASGPALGVICHGLAYGALLDQHRRIERFDRDERAGDLLGQVLGHIPGCGGAGCPMCAAMQAGEWSGVLAATGTAEATVRDAYTLSVETGWMPPLPDAPAPRRAPVGRGRILEYQGGVAREFDEDDW